MQREELSELGVLLAAELDQLATKYHVKSDEHEILVWEADIIREKSKDVLLRFGLSENLKESTLLSSWGMTLANKIPKITEKVKFFHSQYAVYK